MALSKHVGGRTCDQESVGRCLLTFSAATGTDHTLFKLSTLLMSNDANNNININNNNNKNDDDGDNDDDGVDDDDDDDDGTDK